MQTPVFDFPILILCLGDACGLTQKKTCIDGHSTFFIGRQKIVVCYVCRKWRETFFWSEAIKTDNFQKIGLRLTRSGTLSRYWIFIKFPDLKCRWDEDSKMVRIIPVLQRMPKLWLISGSAKSHQICRFGEIWDFWQNLAFLG